MDREKAIDWIYGEQLLQPIGERTPSEKRTLSEEEQRRGPPLDVMSGFAQELVNRLFSVGLSLERARGIVGDGLAGDRVAAATGELDRMISDIRAMMFSLAADARNRSPQRWPLPGGHPGRSGESLDWVMNSIADVGVALQAAVGQPCGTAGPHITEARRRLDEVAQAIRAHVLARRAQPGLAWRPALGGQERPVPTADRAALIQRMAHTARALQETAAGAAALLEQQADLARQPARMDYPTEIKRWRAFADQARQMAKRWEQQP